MALKSPSDSSGSGSGPDVFHGEGNAARLCRELDWAETPLGAVASWPASLCAIASAVVASPLPMAVLWGPQLVQIHNDHYAELMAGNYPCDMGQATRHCWPAASTRHSPLYDSVIDRGESFTVDNQLSHIERQGQA
jgi:hypothetical protein